MIYELKIALRTIRNEGVGPLCGKMFDYFRDIASASSFRYPKDGTVEEVVDFSMNTRLIGIGQNPQEFLDMCRIVKKFSPRTVLEIGTARGGTLAAWCALSHPQAEIASVDMPGGIHGGGYSAWRGKFYQKEFPRPSQKLTLIRADSHAESTLAQVRQLFPNGIDFLFIDGDHTYDGLKKDFDMYTPLVKPDGIIAIHDICRDIAEIQVHVKPFWDEIKGKYSSKELIENSNRIPLGIGVLFKKAELVPSLT